MHPTQLTQAIQFWLEGAGDQLERVLAPRIDRIGQIWSEHRSWLVVALPAAAGRAYGVPEARLSALVAGCALFYAAADLIDDAQDGDLPADLSWPQAVNGGNALLFAALGAFGAAAPGAPVAQEVAVAGRELCAGQAGDLDLVWEPPPTEDAVMAAVRGKTGGSVALYCRMSALAADRPDHEVARWGALGVALGTALQLRTDVGDLMQARSRDLAARKATLPLAYALRRDPDALLKAAAAGDQAGVIAALRSCGAFTFVEFKIAALVAEVMEHLALLSPEPAAQKELEALVEQATAAPLPV